MAVDLEKLVVSLEANLKQYERELARAQKTTVTKMRQVERDMTSIGTRIERRAALIGKGIAKGIGGGFLAGGLAGLVSQQTFRQLGQMVKSVADLGDEAERAGVSAEVLQSLGFVARQNGIEVDTLTDALKKLNLEVGEALTKGNDLGKIFAANGKVFSKDAAENFRTVADLIANARTEQDKAVIGAAAFGKAYGDLIPLLNLAAEGIRKGEQAARDTGVIISNDLVAKAQEFDDRWTAAMDQFGARGKSVLLSLLVQMDTLISTVDQFLKAAGSAETSLSLAMKVLSGNPLTASSMWLIDNATVGNADAAKEIEKLRAQKLEIQKIADEFGGPAAAEALKEQLLLIDQQIAALQKRNNVAAGRGDESGFGSGRVKKTSIVPLTITGEDAPKKILETTSAVKELSSRFDDLGSAARDAGDAMKDAFDKAQAAKAAEAFEKFKSNFGEPMEDALASIISRTSSVSDAVDQMFKNIQGNLASQVSRKLIDLLFGFMQPGGGGPSLLFNSFKGGGGTPPSLFAPSAPPSLASGGGGKVAVNVMNFGGAKIETQERRGPGGERQIMLMIDRRIAQQIGDPYSRSSQALNARGVKSPVILR